MRILFVHERFGAYGRAEANVLATATELKRRGHDVGVLQGPATGRAEPGWEEAFGDRFPLAPENSAGAANAALENFQPDLVYVHQMVDLPALAALVTAGVPLVGLLHEHDSGVMSGLKCFGLTRPMGAAASLRQRFASRNDFFQRNRTRSFPLKWVGRMAKGNQLRLSRQFHRLVVHSHSMRAELMRNGIPAEQIELHAPIASDSDAGFCSSFSDRNLIVYAGQIARGKGLDVLLEALAAVRVPFECAVLGDGNHRPACEDLSRKLGLGGRVGFKGYIRCEELKEYYRECSLAVMSSVWPEPFGMQGLEAMRYGLPVVGFDTGGIKEWVVDGRNGFLVPRMDRTAYAARVEELLGDKTLARQMGEIGRLLVSEHYDFSRTITRLEDLFARVVAETRGRISA